MLFATVGQGALFVWMAAAGAAIGLWYELCALLRRLTGAGLCLGLGCDLLFGLGGGALLFAALVAGDYGRLRPFALLGALLGALAFRLGLAPPLRALGRALARHASRIVTLISRNRLMKIIFR